jgi:hypothetical protein
MRHFDMLLVQKVLRSVGASLWVSAEVPTSSYTLQPSKTTLCAKAAAWVRPKAKP